MHFGIFATYAGPDQVMTVTSGLASLFGLLLIFWNKVVGTFFKVFGAFCKKDATAPAAVEPPNKAV